MVLIFAENGIIESENNKRISVKYKGRPITRQMFDGRTTFYVCDTTLFRHGSDGILEDPRASEIIGAFFGDAGIFCKYIGDPSQNVLRVNDDRMLVSVRDNNLVIQTPKGLDVYPGPELSSYQFDPSTSEFTKDRFFGCFLRVVGTKVESITINIIIPEKIISMAKFTSAFENPRLIGCGSILVVVDKGFVHKHISSGSYKKTAIIMDDYRYSRTNDAIIGSKGTQRCFIQSNVFITFEAEEEILE